MSFNANELLNQELSAEDQIPKELFDLNTLYFSVEAPSSEIEGLVVSGLEDFFEGSDIHDVKKIIARINYLIHEFLEKERPVFISFLKESIAELILFLQKHKAYIILAVLLYQITGYLNYDDFPINIRDNLASVLCYNFNDFVNKSLFHDVRNIGVAGAYETGCVLGDDTQKLCHNIYARLIGNVPPNIRTFTSQSVLHRSDLSQPHCKYDYYYASALVIHPACGDNIKPVYTAHWLKFPCLFIDRTNELVNNYDSNIPYQDINYYLRQFSFNQLTWHAPLLPGCYYKVRFEEERFYSCEQIDSFPECVYSPATSLKDPVMALELAKEQLQVANEEKHPPAQCQALESLIAILERKVNDTE